LARDQVCHAVAAGGYGRREILVRVNGLATEWGKADLAAAAKSGADAVVLPKVESAAMVHEAEAVLRAAGAPAELDLWAMIETPRGVLAAVEIAAATPGMAGLIMGTSDLAKDLHVAHRPDRLAFIASLSLCVLAARAAGIAILDGVHLDLDDEEGFEAVCHQGRDLGFDGKTLIHPKTIAPANRIFAPDEAEVVRSRRIIAAHAEAEAQGKGVVVLDGRLIENLHVEEAKRIVALAEMIATQAAGAAQAP